MTERANVNYMQLREQTHEEKLAMYMKCKKKQLAEMLIECNRIIALQNPSIGTTGYVFKKSKTKK